MIAPVVRVATRPLAEPDMDRGVRSFPVRQREKGPGSINSWLCRVVGVSSRPGTSRTVGRCLSSLFAAWFPGGAT